MADLKIDDASYQEGRASFASGASLREVVEFICAADVVDEHKVMSSAVGFFDALLDLLRSTKKANT